MTGTAYEYSTLKQAVTKPSPLRGYLVTTFPNRKAIAAAYKKSTGPIRALGTGVNATTIGTAFDNLVRLVLEPDELPWPACRGGLKLGGPQVIGALADLREYGSVSPEGLARTSWVFALFTEAYRNPLPPESLIAALNDRNLCHDTLLALASDAAVEDLVQLHEVAQESFYPLMAGPLEAGPSFNGDLPIKADGDLINDGTLIEVKTTLGEKNSKGQRYSNLEPDTLFQLLAYTLIDTNDEHKINGLGIYSSRYGDYYRWELDELLEELAGRPVDLAAERERVRRLIAQD